MKPYLILPAAVALFAAPALAQSNDSNLETQRDVLEGARESQGLGPMDYGPRYYGPGYYGEPAVGPVYEGRSSVAGETNDSNLETQEDVLRGAAESADPEPWID